MEIEKQHVSILKEIRAFGIYITTIVICLIRLGTLTAINFAIEKVLVVNPTSRQMGSFGIASLKCRLQREPNKYMPLAGYTLEPHRLLKQFFEIVNNNEQ